MSNEFYNKMDESLAWEIGAKLNKLLGFAIPQPYYDKKVEQHLSFLEEGKDEHIDWDAFSSICNYIKY